MLALRGPAPTHRTLAVVGAASAFAWLAVLAAAATGEAAFLHHHALIEHGPPLAVAALLFIVAWQVMVAAMMLPASAPAILAASRGVPAVGALTLTAFIGAYAIVWAAFGLGAFFGDVVVHHVVDATPWLEARPWALEAGVLTLAGAYQFTTLKRTSLMACRHPAEPAVSAPPSARRMFQMGLDHGLACLRSSWALMLVMFAAGFANLAWMAVLTAFMTYETLGRHGRRFAPVAGGIVLLVAVTIVLAGATAAI